jgi:hypothetical protein
MYHRIVRIVTVIALGVAGLAAASGSAGAASAHHRITPATGLQAGVMPMRGASPQATPSTVTAHLVYNGGPVISNADVETVRWGTGTYSGNFSTMDSFFGGVVRSQYMSWLKEYNTTGQSIGYGTFRGDATITPPSGATTIDDSVIQQAIVDNVNSGVLPPPATDSSGNVNTVYAMFFPDGDVIRMSDGSLSGQVFCAYHSSTGTTVDGLHLPYLILPDPHSMGQGCGTSGDQGNLQSYSSHELIESITDPQVGQSVLSWYDSTNGEIGDICNAQTGNVTDTNSASWLVQKEWSNTKGACITNYPAATPDPPTLTAATSHAGGHVSVSWTAPSNDGEAPISQYSVFRSTTPGALGTAIAPTFGTVTSYNDTPGSDGTYYYSIEATNLAGTSSASNQVAGISDRKAPVAKLTAPSTLFGLTSSIKPAYSATDANGVASYDVRYRVAAWNGSFGAYKQPASWQGTHAKTVTLSASPGHEYCFGVRARDTVGNVGAWTSDRCEAIALDDRALSRSAHWTLGSASSAYKGTLTKTTTKNATLTLAGLQGKRIALVVTTCSNCGHVKVFLGKTLLGTVNTQSSKTATKVIKALAPFSLRTATLKLVAADTGKTVIIDGLGVSRT